MDVLSRYGPKTWMFQVEILWEEKQETRASLMPKKMMGMVGCALPLAVPKRRKINLQGR